MGWDCVCLFCSGRTDRAWKGRDGYGSWGLDGMNGWGRDGRRGLESRVE